MLFSCQSLLAASFFALKVVAVGIIDFDNCNFPYIVPRAFETQCQPADQLVDEFMLPLKTAPGLKGTHPQWIASMLIRSKPNVWTMEPWCLESNEANSGICVYTSSKFMKGRGISFVASPKEVHLITRASAFYVEDDDEIAPWVNPEKEERMEVLPVPGKGLGVRAKHLFRRGDVAQSYTPVLVVQDFLMQHSAVNDKHNVLRLAVERLPPKSRDLFNGLMGQWGGDPYYDKVNTNAFTSYAGKSFQYYWAVYPETSRYNHDCRPNAMYSIDEDSFLHNLRIARTIIPGEEVTLSYLSPNMVSADRKTRMNNQWGFNCSCTLCSSTPDVLASSDIRIELIDQLEAELNDLSADRTADITSAEFLINLYKQERLDGVIGDAYMYAAFESAYLGFKRRTQMYAAMAIEHMSLWRGVQHEYTQAMHRLLVDPESQPSWGFHLPKKEEVSNKEKDSGGKEKKKNKSKKNKNKKKD